MTLSPADADRLKQAFQQCRDMQRWDAGYRHTKAVLERRPWVGEFDPLSGVVLHEQMEEMAEAAE